MSRLYNIKALMRRMVTIDYEHKHRHLPGSLSALPIIAQIYADMDLAYDVFILSKGHSCAALYAALEWLGYHPNCALVHPERDAENGVTMTAGSLGHGLPTAVGTAWAKRHLKEPGLVHVLVGDGELQEGSNWEALNLARMFGLENLRVHVDFNFFQGSAALLTQPCGILQQVFPMELHFGHKGYGIARFQNDPVKSVHALTETEYAQIMEELK